MTNSRKVHAPPSPGLAIGFAIALVCGFGKTESTSVNLTRPHYHLLFLPRKVRECDVEELEAKLEECNADPEVHGKLLLSLLSAVRTQRYVLSRSCWLLAC